MHPLPFLAMLAVVPVCAWKPGWSVFDVKGTSLLPAQGSTLWTTQALGEGYAAQPRYFSRFDGRTWIPTPLDSIFGSEYAAAAADPGGGLWLGDTDRIACLQGSAWRHYRDLPRRALPSGSGDSKLIIETMAADSFSVWAAGRLGSPIGPGRQTQLLRFDGKSWRAFPDTALNGRMPVHLHADGRGGLWLSAISRGDDGWAIPTGPEAEWAIYHCDSRPHCVRIPNPGKFGFDKWNDVAGAEGLWVACAAGLAHWNGGTWSFHEKEVFSEVEYREQYDFFAIAERLGEVWAVGKWGISHRQHGRWDFLPYEEYGIRSDYTRDVDVASDGSIWFKTFDRAARFHPPSATADFRIATPRGRRKLPIDPLGRIVRSPPKPVFYFSTP